MGNNITSVFTVDETHGRAVRRENRLIVHSQSIGWRSLYAAILEEAPLNVNEPSVLHPSLIYHLCRPTAVSRRIDGTRRERVLIGPRRFCITPHGVNAEWEHSGHPEILQIYLRRSIYESAVQEMYGCEPSKAATLAALCDSRSTSGTTRDSYSDCAEGRHSGRWHLCGYPCPHDRGSLGAATFAALANKP